MVVVDQLLDFRIPLVLPFRVIAIPRCISGGGGLMIEVGILRVGAVVGNPGLRPCLIRPVARLEPSKACSQVLRHAKSKAVLASFLLPEPDDILVWSHICRVPPMQF